MLIALGANLASDAGGPEQALRFAVRRIADRGYAVRAVSRFFRTPCFPPGAGPDYVNAALALSTDRPPETILADLHAIESERGRERTARWGMRTLDLDLVAAGDLVLPDREEFARWRDLDPDRQRVAAPDRLILPHPRLQDRAFVLVPMADIAPGWRHPVSGLSVTEMLDLLDPVDVASVVPIAEADC